MTLPSYCTYICRDNSGIRSCYSINRTLLEGQFGRILASLKVVTPNKKVKKGDLLQLVIFGTRKTVTRASGITSSLSYNGVISLKKDGTPVATRLYCPLYLEARHSGYMRLAVLSRGII